MKLSIKWMHCQMSSRLVCCMKSRCSLRRQAGITSPVLIFIVSFSIDNFCVHVLNSSIMQLSSLCTISISAGNNHSPSHTITRLESCLCSCLPCAKWQRHLDIHLFKFISPHYMHKHFDSTSDLVFACLSMDSFILSFSVRPWYSFYFAVLSSGIKRNTKNCSQAQEFSMSTGLEVTREYIRIVRIH